MDKINTVIFDMDGVIFDTERIYLETWTDVFNRYGYKMTKEVYTSVMGVGRKNVINTFKRIYGDDLPIDKMYKEKDDILYNRIEQGTVPTKEGVHEVLSFLKENNYNVALATSAKRERVDKHLKDAKLEVFFDVTVCGDEVEKAKPNPDIFLKAASKLGVDRKRCIVVEDSLAGVKAGNNAGMLVVNIPDLRDYDEELEKFSHKVFKNLIDFKEYLNLGCLKLSGCSF